jgi:antitoxin CcdA
MAESGAQNVKKKATNVSLRADLLAEARELGIGVSEAAEQGLRQAIIRVREQRWLEENRAAMDSANKYIEENGLPLAHHRQF